MARVRIVDEWIRSPVSTPIRHRAVMVVAEQWAEQRVLMRAFADCRDQTRPTIVLFGDELPIGPAGVDAQAAWGIHVEPPVDGRAQELVAHLEEAARRQAGAKGNPPRLQDEASAFERKETNNWAPGSRRDDGSLALRPTYEPIEFLPTPLAPGPPRPQVEFLPAARSAERLPAVGSAERVDAGPAAEVVSAAPSAERVPSHRDTTRGQLDPESARSGRRRGRSTSSIPPLAAKSTSLGYESGSGAQSALVRLGLRPSVSARLSRLAGLTVPSEFSLSRAERDVLNALGEQAPLTARAIGEIAGVADGLAWMERLLARLARHGVDIVEPGPAVAGEPTYALKR